jgi:hypothetical protein
MTTWAKACAMQHWIVRGGIANRPSRPRQCTAAKSWRPGTELSERAALESRAGGQHPRPTSIEANPILIIR